jgi:hypothetical protein
MSARKVTVARTGWGAYIDAEGTAEELITNHLVEREWLAPCEFSKSGQRTRNDQFGNAVTIKRRAGARFHVHIRMYDEDVLDLNAKRTRKLLWFREHGAELDAAVAGALARVRRPPEEAPS